MDTRILLFTRDLRVHDHPALAAAGRGGARVVPVFVFDDELLSGRAGPNRIAFLLESLRDLDGALRARGARLVIRSGDPVEETLTLAGQTDARAIHLSEDVSAYARRREQRLARECERGRIALRTFSGVTVMPPGELLPAGGDHYRVFTPYWNAWRAARHGAPLLAPRRLRMPTGIRPGSLPPRTAVARGSLRGLPRGGEGPGRAALTRWLRRGPERYEQANRLDLAATSGLSPYLHFGCLSAREVVDRVEGGNGGEAFIRQLCWRDFHHQVLAARPDMPYADYRPRGRRWRHDRRLLEAWQEGLTGYPVVDAGMRQLATEGFMHNRARLIVASFLTKTLGLDWRDGAIHFERLLVDGDLANNVGNWQWAAGTGNDTRSNRVLNPIRQARRFDPDGTYVRRLVPELAALEGRAVHEPWKLAPHERARLHYPDPLLPPPG